MMLPISPSISSASINGERVRISADTDMKYLQTVTRNLLNLSPSREMSLLSTARCVLVPTLEPACLRPSHSESWWVTEQRWTFDETREPRRHTPLVESRNQ